MALSNAVGGWEALHDHELDVWQVRGTLNELNSEVVRLFALDSSNDPMLAAMDVGFDEMAAYRLSTLAQPGGALFVAQRSGRLEGLLFLLPEGLQTAVLGHYIWSVEQLVTAPGAPFGTVAALVETALGLMPQPVECLLARVPSRDPAAVSGLQEQGFEAVGSEVVGVLECHQPSAKPAAPLRLAPLQKRYLRAAAELIRHDGDCTFLPAPARVRASRVSRLCECLLAGYVEEPRAGGLVVEAPSGDLLGFITYRRNTWLGEFTSRTLASLDFFGVHPDGRSNGVGELLHRHALSALCAQSVDAIEVRTPANRPEAGSRLEVLRKLGCRAFSSDVIFQRWLGRGAGPC